VPKLKYILVLASILLVLSCGETPEQKADYTELRIHRWTALEGGETLVMRRIGSEWSAMLLGDGERFSCPYQKTVIPKSGWENVWKSLVDAGIFEISEGRRLLGIEDGNGFEVEIFYENQLRRFMIRHAESQKSEDAERILRIGDIVSNEFNTPVFLGKYDRGTVGEYLIELCKAFEK
jgi:hypothetical protein